MVILFLKNLNGRKRGFMIIQSIKSAISGTKMCWMHDEGEDYISIMAIVPSKTQFVKDNKKSDELAKRAKAKVTEVAQRVGNNIINSGVFMGGNGNGEILATGIADIPWSLETEKKLFQSGITQLQ